MKGCWDGVFDHAVASVFVAIEVFLAFVVLTNFLVAIVGDAYDEVKKAYRGSTSLFQQSSIPSTYQVSMLSVSCKCRALKIV